MAQTTPEAGQDDGPTGLPPTRAPEGTVTGRALLLGALGSLAIGLGAPWAEHILHGSYMALDFSTPGAVSLLLFLAAVPQTLLFKLRSRLRLTTAEMVTIFSMMIVASAIVTMGLTAQLIPLTTAPYYYATPENKWGALLLGSIPSWAAPAGAHRGAPVIEYLYEGLPTGQGVPWRAWLPMLGAWLPFLLALYSVMIALMVLLRRRWADEERLTYPLTQLPLELSGVGSHGFPALLRNRIFQYGVALPVLFGLITGLHTYVPMIPAPNFVYTMPVFRKHLALQFRLSWPMLGFFYLVTSESTFSLWFFNRLFFVARGVMGFFGIGGSEKMGGFGTLEPYFAHLGTGAFLAMFLASLWGARHHLRRAWRLVYGEGDPAYQSPEIMSFKTAFRTVGVGLLFMGWWLVKLGMPWFAVPLFLLLAMVFFVGLTRAVVEVGFAEAVAPKIAPDITISWLGNRVLGRRGMVAAGLSYVWCSDIRTFVMCSVANSLKMAETIEHKRHRLLWGYFISIAVAFISSFWLTLSRAYRQGGVTMNDWFFRSGPQLSYQYLAGKISHPSGPSWGGMGLAAGGGLFYTLLTFLRFQYPAWPFHPMGFALGSTWIMDNIWFTAFAAWGLKSLILHYGGGHGYAFLRPAFLGMICGQFAVNVLWLIIDQLAGTTGNMVFWI